MDLSGYFTEPEGEALTYSATSSTATVATATVANMTLTVTAVAAGKSTITVRRAIPTS